MDESTFAAPIVPGRYGRRALTFAAVAASPETG